MNHRITVLPTKGSVVVPSGTNLLKALRTAGIAPDAPCGGTGKCGKCTVIVDGSECLSCQITVDRDLTVNIPQKKDMKILHAGIEIETRLNPLKEGHLIAIDIGTTSVVCFLIDGNTGRELAKASMLNPQTVFGADVISRIQAALQGELAQQTKLIREGMTNLICQVCYQAQVSPEEIGVVSVVGNPAMQQLFLGISPDNLSGVPFEPVLTEAKTIPSGQVLPVCKHAELLIVPDISGYIGADTMGCVLSTKMYSADEITLMVDIGTNGEMVLGNRNRMIACSTAAGPALEGANIHFGMRGTEGAIDHVWLENGKPICSVIGGGEAMGICGSGLIDAIAVGLEMGLLNKRGRIQNEDHVFHLTDKIYLTQDDIRQVQLAKGAIYAGILLMSQQLGVAVEDIQQVLLAGAFGNYMNPSSACRIGLLPEVLLNRIEAVGNAAGSGARMLACDRELLPLIQKLKEDIAFLELANLPQFSKTFAKAMNFRE